MSRAHDGIPNPDPEPTAPAEPLRESRIATEPATPEACAQDYANRVGDPNPGIGLLS